MFDNSLLMMWVLMLWTIVLSLYITTISASSCPNNCAGHGMCEIKGVCKCFEGWTHAPDCSQKSCPFGTAWVDKPYSVDIVHQKAECSNAGTCNREYGLCECFPGFTGNACQRSNCPNDCNGHGVCSTLGEVARFTGPDYDSVLERAGDGKGIGYSNWDKDAIQICECDDGYFGYDCSQVMCPKGDDPVTINQQTRAIRMHVRTTGDSELYSGQIGLRFQGKTAFIDLEYIYTRYYPCNDKIAFKGKFAHVTCVQATWTTQYYYFDLYFESWPIFPKDNNLYNHYGNPNILEFFCDISYAPPGTYCEFEDIYANNVREYAFCSNRGTCDFKTGICKCMDGYGGPSCGNATAVYSASDSVTPGLAVNVVNYDYTSTVLQVKTAKPPMDDFNIMETIAGDQSLFYIRGDGLVGIHSIQTLTMGQTISGGGLGIMTGGATLYDDGMKIFANAISTSVAEFSNRYYGHDNLGYSAVEISTDSPSWQGHTYLTCNHLDDPKLRFRADGKLFVYDGGVRVTGGGTIYNTGLLVTDGVSVPGGNVVIRKGGMIGTGGVTVETEGIRVITGGIQVTGGMSIISRGMRIVSGASVVSLGVTATTGCTINAGGLAVTGGLSINYFGLRATGGMTVNQGQVQIVTGGMTVHGSGGYVTSGGVTVYGSLKIDDSGMELTNTGITVRNGLARMLDGMYVHNGITVASNMKANFNAGLSVHFGIGVTGGMTVSDGVVVTHGITVHGGEVRIADGVVVQGDLRVFGASNFENAYTVFSDRRLKTNVRSIEDALEKVTALRGVYFNWAQSNKEDAENKTDNDSRTDKTESSNTNNKERINRLIDELSFEKSRQIGVIAQEVQKVLPEVVRPHTAESDLLEDSSMDRPENEKESPLLTVDYASIVPVLIESVHDLKNKTDSLREECQSPMLSQEDEEEIEHEAAKLREELVGIKEHNTKLKGTLYQLMQELKVLKANRT